MLLPVELSQVGITRARVTLDEVEARLGCERARAVTTKTETPSTGPAAGGQQRPEIVTVYEHALTIPESRTPRLLELFARKDMLTPEEIGVELGNGQPLSKAQARAIVRNLSRMQGHLLEQGRVSNTVLVKDFAGYEKEGAGRYGLSDEDRAALRAHLGSEPLAQG